MRYTFSCMFEQMDESKRIEVEQQRGMGVRRALAFVREHAGRISSMRFNAFLRQLDESTLPERTAILRDHQGRIKEIGLPALQWIVERLQNERPIAPSGWLSLEAMRQRLGCGQKLMLEIVSDILPSEDEADFYKDPTNGVGGLYYHPDLFRKCEQALPFYRERRRQIRKEVARRVNRERLGKKQTEAKEDDRIPRVLDMAATMVFLRARRTDFVPSQFSRLIRALEQSDDPAKAGIIRDPQVGTISEVHHDALQWLLHAPVSVEANEPLEFSEGEKRRIQREELWKKKSLGYQQRLIPVINNKRIPPDVHREVREVLFGLIHAIDPHERRAIVTAADILLAKTGYDQ